MTEVTEPDPARPSVLFCKYLRAVIHSVSVLRLSQKKRAFVGARGAVGTLKLKTGQTFLLLRSDRKLGPSIVGAWLVPPRSGLGGLSLACWGEWQRASGVLVGAVPPAPLPSALCHSSRLWASVPPYL